MLAIGACAQIVGLGPERERVETSIGAGGTGGESAGAGGDVTTPCTGDVAWVRQFGNEVHQAFKTAAPDAEGGVFVTGYFSGTLELGGAPLISDLGTDIFLARFDANGHHLWSRRFPDDADASAADELHVARTPDGGVVIAGMLVGTVHFGGEPLIAIERDAFAASFDASGTHRWSTRWGDADWQGVRSMAVDGDGNVVLGGFFHQSIDFGGDLLTAASTPGADAFIAKLNAEGDHLWSYGYGAPEGGEYTNAVAVDANGNVAFGGSADGSMSLGQGPRMHYGDDSSDAWLAVYTPLGNPIWTAMYADEGFEAVRNIAFTASGDLIFSGQFGGTLDLGGPPLSAPSSSLFLAHLDPDGLHLHSKAIAGIHDTHMLEVDAQDNIHLTGIFSAPIDPGGGELMHVGKLDGVMVRLTSELDYLWSLQVGSGEDDDFYGLALPVDGSAFVLSTFHDVASIAGCGNFQSAGGPDMLLVKLAPF